MQLTIKNSDIFPAIDFLQRMQELPAQVSRARTKLIKQLTGAGDEYVDSQKQIVTDNGGSINEQGQIEGLTPEADANASQDMMVLANETITIEPMYNQQFETLRGGFEEYNGVISPEHANIFDTLYDALDINEDEQD